MKAEKKAVEKAESEDKKELAAMAAKMAAMEVKLEKAMANGAQTGDRQPGKGDRKGRRVWRNYGQELQLQRIFQSNRGRRAWNCMLVQSCRLPDRKGELLRASSCSGLSRFVLYWE